jgi:pilus assembly protein CpaC
MRGRLFVGTLAVSGALCLGPLPAFAQVQPHVIAQNSPAPQNIAASQAPAPAPQETLPAAARDLYVTVGKSVVIDSPVNIQRVSVADGTIAEAVAATPREVLINGKAPGETSLIIWQEGGNRLFFDLHVRPSTLRLEAVRQELAKELAGQDVTIDLEGTDVFLRGTANDLTSAERAVTIAGTLGKTVNLLDVKVPPVEPQILLKVRFADVDRAATSDLGANFFSTGALNTTGSISTGGFTPPQPGGSVGGGANPAFTLTDALNVFLFRPDLDLGTTIRALQSKRLLQILAEPNLLTINGKSASFLAGGEFPYPTLQGGGGGLGAVTIQFREFGVRITFLPNVTPRGTIRMQVTPEVSSLDYANALTFQGFTIPGLASRRVQTEIELETGQSFAIGGLLDNRVTESLNKIPGLGDIPLFGKLFQSRSLTKNNTELLVMVTPELVRPIPEGQPRPEIKMPKEWLKGAPQVLPRTPAMEVTGPVPVKPPKEAIPMEDLIESEKTAPSAAPATMGPVQYVPVPMMPAPVQPAPAQPSPAPATPKPPAGGANGGSG